MLAVIAIRRILSSLQMQKHGKFNPMVVFTLRGQNGEKTTGQFILEFLSCEINSGSFGKFD